MNNRIQAKLHITLLSVCFSAITLSMSAVMIHRNHIEQHVRQAAQNYISIQGFSPSSIPQRLTSEYESIITDAVTALRRIADSGERSYVDDTEIEQIVPQKVERFVQTMRSLVFSYDLDSKVTESIHTLFQKNSLNPDAIPASMVSEYHRIGKEITQKLRRTMANDNRNYVRINEIESIVRNDVSNFINRVKNNTPSNTQNNTSWNLWDWFSGSNSHSNNNYNSPSNSSAPSSAIKRHELDKKTLDAVYKVLRNHRINPDKVPARVVSDYSDKVQTIIKRMQTIMSQNYRDYVYKNELELAAGQEMQSIIDKINYVGETCTICLDSYVKNQKVGLLSCGHTFHKDCIYSWLEHQKNCPLCRQNNVIVATHETVP